MNLQYMIITLDKDTSIVRYIQQMFSSIDDALEYINDHEGLFLLGQYKIIQVVALDKINLDK